MYAFARRNDPTRQKFSAIMLLLATLALMLACAMAAGTAPSGRSPGFSPQRQVAADDAVPLDDGAIKAEMAAKAQGVSNRA